MKIERTGKNVLTVRLERKAGNCGEFLLIGDLHWDSVHCERKLLKRTLDEAVRRGAGILIGGDLFDAMMSVGDKRGTKEGLRPEFSGGNYLDLLVDGAVEWFRPYSHNLVMVGSGNHDTAIIKYHESDLVSRFCHALNVQHMGYSCFVDFMFEKSNNGGRKSFDLYYHHGYGGGGPVTKGVIGNARRAMSYDADVFWSQHVHETVYTENVRTYLARVGAKREVRERREAHVIGGGFKHESSMEGGFHTEKGRPAKPLGGWWLKFIQRDGELDFVLERTS